MVTRILLPTDGSAGAQRAADQALKIAECFGATIHALHVTNTRFPDGVAEGRWIPWDAAVEYLDEHAEAFMEDLDQAGAGRGVEVRSEVRPGAPIHEVILEAAEDHDVDLVVLGTHGRSGLNRFLLGSVSEKVLRTSHVPVLAVPIHPSDEEVEQAVESGPARDDAELDEAMGNDPDDASSRGPTADTSYDPSMERREVEAMARVEGDPDEPRSED